MNGLGNNFTTNDSARVHAGNIHNGDVINSKFPFLKVIFHLISMYCITKLERRTNISPTDHPAIQKRSITSKTSPKKSGTPGSSKPHMKAKSGASSY